LSEAIRSLILIVARHSPLLAISLAVLGWHAQAKQTYLSCLEKFGTTQWISDAPIETIDDAELPLWMREDVEECA